MENAVTSIKALLIEDNPGDARLIKELLSEAGTVFDLSHAGRLDEGLMLLAVKPFDVLLLDLNLPDSNGLETVRKVRSQTSSIPIVILTGLDDESTGVSAIHEGAQDYLVKGQIDARLIARAVRYAIERKKTEEALRESEDKFYSISALANEAIIVMDNDGKISFWNNAAERLFGHQAQDSLGREAHKILLPERYYDDSKTGFLKFKTTGKGPVVGGIHEVTARKKDGTEFPIELSVSAVSHQGKWNAIGVVRDITVRKKTEETLRTLSLMDELTGLYNRRGFFLLAGQQMKLAHRKKKKMALLFCDIDDLKRINDNFGHKEGDKVLMEVANILMETFRESDVIARLGGDEFAALVIDAEGYNDESLAARLQYKLEVHNNRLNLQYKISLSAGIAQCSVEIPCAIEELLSQADKAMYEQKQRKKRQ